MFDWFDTVVPGYCCLILPRIVWPMALADGAIFLSYMIIGGWLLSLSFIKNPHGKVMQGGIFLLALFILLCGLGHAIDVAKVWYPLCDTMVVERLATAAVSMLTWIWAWRHKKMLLQILVLRR